MSGFSKGRKAKFQGKYTRSEAVKLDTEVIRPVYSGEKFTELAKRELGKTQNITEGRIKMLVGQVMGAEEFRRLKVCDLSQTPGDLSCLEDPIMGSKEQGETCTHCFCDFMECSGHWGIISLDDDSWFLHPYFVDDGTIAAILNLFCYECFKEKLTSNPHDTNVKATCFFDYQSKIILMDRYDQVKGMERIKALAARAEGRLCSDRDRKHPYTYFKKADGGEKTLVHAIKASGKVTEKEVSARSLFYHLSSISNFAEENNLYEFLGISPVRFENFVIQLIPVIPPRFRLPQYTGGRQKQESSFTILYQKILTIVHEMKLPQNEKNTAALTEYRKQIRDLYYQYVKPDKTGNFGGKKGRDDIFKTLKFHLDGKKALWHKNTMASRVDNSGRTVIVGNNDLKPNQVLIPRYMADKWRIKLDVTGSNKDIAEKLLRDGIIKTVVRRRAKGRNKLDVKEITDTNRDSFKLEIEDITYRKLITGDVVVINRQPTLHRFSVMAMIAVVPNEEDEVPGFETNTVGLNTIYAPGFNADFDGDEVHVHVPGTVDARAEALALMAVEKVPISDQTSKNIFALIQNTVWGSYEMTRNPRNIDKELWMHMTTTIQNFPAPPGSNIPDYDLAERIKYIERMVPVVYHKHGIKGLGIYNTLSLLSLAMPPDFGYVIRKDKQTPVIIDRGIVVSGIFGKSIVGSEHRSIIQQLFYSHGPVAITIFGHVMQQVVSKWMDAIGFTISITDFMPSQYLEPKIEALKDAHLRKVEEISQRTIAGIFNRDVLVSNLKEWIVVDDKYLAVVSKQNLGELVSEILITLFEYLQIERNLYVKGRSTKPFEEQRVKDALVNSFNKIFPTGKTDKPQVKTGSLLSTMRTTRSDKTASQNLLDEFKRTQVDLLYPRLLEFVNEQYVNPFDTEAIIAKSMAELDTIEANILDILDVLKEAGEKLLADNPNVGGSVDPMIKSGARGKIENLGQAKFGVGQQTMSGGRLKPAISGGTRVNPFFLENSSSAASRGYVRNSYFRGLTPAEVFASAQPARQTQTDTAFKTGEAGYMQKRLLAFCGDFRVKEDGTVRDEKNQIVTYAYGGNFLSPSRMTKKDDVFVFVDVEQIIEEIKTEEEAIEKTRRIYNKLI